MASNPFLTQVPGSMNLTTEADMNFDITRNLAFQGMPVLDFSASSEGMSLYIEAQGRAINSKGDIVLMAEGTSGQALHQANRILRLEHKVQRRRSRQAVLQGQ